MVAKPESENGFPMSRLSHYSRVYRFSSQLDRVSPSRDGVRVCVYPARSAVLCLLAGAVEPRSAPERASFPHHETVSVHVFALNIPLSTAQEVDQIR